MELGVPRTKMRPQSCKASRSTREVITAWGQWLVTTTAQQLHVYDSLWFIMIHDSSFFYNFKRASFYSSFAYGVEKKSTVFLPLHLSFPSPLHKAVSIVFPESLPYESIEPFYCIRDDFVGPICMSNRLHTVIFKLPVRFWRSFFDQALHPLSRTKHAVNRRVELHILWWQDTWAATFSRGKSWAKINII